MTMVMRFAEIGYFTLGCLFFFLGCLFVSLVGHARYEMELDFLKAYTSTHSNTPHQKR